VPSMRARSGGEDLTCAANRTTVGDAQRRSADRRGVGNSPGEPAGIGVAQSPPVLTLTDNAATEIRNLTADAELPEGCGMRIANDPASNALTLTLVPTPAVGDQVLEEDGARVFLDQQAAALLDDRALDAEPDNAGQVKFTIADTPHS
jgi:iron-sulfur cluster assembly protein